MRKRNVTKEIIDFTEFDEEKALGILIKICDVYYKKDYAILHDKLKKAYKWLHTARSGGAFIEQSK